jgi:hypothetical protein
MLDVSNADHRDTRKSDVECTLIIDQNEGVGSVKVEMKDPDHRLGVRRIQIEQYEMY